MRLGIDAQFATFTPRAGLFVHHRELLRELRDVGGVDATLFLNGWNFPPERHGIVCRDVSTSLHNLPTHVVTLPGRLRTLRLRLSPLGRMDAFYHVFGGTFEAIPGIANVYLVPDVIPLAVDYAMPAFRERSVAYYNRALDNADVVIVYSEHTKRDLQTRLGANPDRIVVAPLAAGDEYRPVGDRVALAAYLDALGIGSAPYVLAVGTIELRKNIEILVRAFAQMKRQMPELPHKLVLCGGKGVGHEAVFKAVEQEQIGGQVVVLGYVERVELLYNGASVFAFPSRYEGFGLPPLEAMACGTPVVAANATSVPEVVGDAALLFEVDNVDALCDAMRQVLCDASLAARLRAAGLLRGGQFTWRRTALQTRAAVQLAIDNRRRGKVRR
jgi:glycosyltransferase involved in cell wall biosynthesis